MESAKDIKIRDQRFMREALLMAQLAQETGEVPVGAVLVKDDQIISKGFKGMLSGEFGMKIVHLQILSPRLVGKEVWKDFGTTQRIWGHKNDEKL